MTHHDHTQLWAVPTPHWVKSLNQVIFPFISYFSHDESLCFILLFIFFLIYHLICHVVLWWTFWKIPMTHDEQSLTIAENVLSRSGFPHDIRRLSCLRERTNQIRIHSQLSFFPQEIISSTVLIATSGLSAILFRSQPLWLCHQSVFILCHQS